MFFGRTKKSNSIIEIVSDNIEENKQLDDNGIQEADKEKVFEKVDEKEMEMSKTLMIYIGVAIDKWAQEYDMEKLPRNIVFKKALVLMNLWENVDDFK